MDQPRLTIVIILTIQITNACICELQAGCTVVQNRLAPTSLYQDKLFLTRIVRHHPAVGRQTCIRLCLADCHCGSLSHNERHQACYLYDHKLTPDMDTSVNDTGLEYLTKSIIFQDGRQTGKLKFFLSVTGSF